MSDAGPTAGGDLEEQRRFLLDSLRDLEREKAAGEIDEGDYQRLRDDYTARAAAVLRQIEAQDGEGASSVATSEGGRVRRRIRARREVKRTPGVRSAGGKRGQVSSGAFVAICVGTGIVVLSLGAVALFIALSNDKPAPSPTASRIAGQLQEAHRLEGEQKAAEALKLYDAVIKEDPNNAEAYAHRGWLLALASRGAGDSPEQAVVREELLSRAMTSLDRAVQLGGYPDAHFFRAMVLYRFRNDPAAAVPEFETFLASNPPADSAVAVRNLLNQAREAAGGGAPPSGGG